MHGKQCPDERLYLRRKFGGRGIKSLKDMEAETEVTVACYMTFSSSMWIEEAWKREVKLEEKSIKNEAEEALKKINISLELRKRWSMARKRTIRRRMKRNMEKTKTLNEGKVRKL